MGELVSVKEIVKTGFKLYDVAHYEKKKREIFAFVDERTERVSNGMIYCRKCYNPKVADFPEKNFITRCACKCEAEAWERERSRITRPLFGREIRAGDWNPFDN